MYVLANDSVCARVCVWSMCVYDCVSYVSCRYAFTILSNVGVFAAMFLLLKFVGSESNQDKSNSTAVLYRYQVPYQDHSNTTVAQITPSDEWIFSVRG